jgi:adenylate cyclase
MNDLWQLRVSEGDRPVYVAELTGPAEIGRQQSDAEKLPSHFRKDGRWRVVIAPLKETTISRMHLEVKPLAGGRFVLHNRSTNQVVDGLPGGALKPGDSCETTMRAVIQLGNKTIRLSMVEENEDEPLESLSQATLAPGSHALLVGAELVPDNLMGWIQAFLGLLNHAAGTDDFFVKASRALVDLVKLDSGRILLRRENSWQQRAVQHRPASSHSADWQPSNTVLSKVLREKKTFWQVPREGVSTKDVEAVVAAPILNRRGEVIGALYGERRLMGTRVQGPISRLEAMFVEVLAGGVAAGLARVEQEQAALRVRLQMEQFFGQRLGAKLVDHPELLVGRSTLVTILMCDISGFSRISEKLGPVRTVEWIVDVMSDLSQCVLERAGIVVDYAGDGLMALWGAPEDQSDHAVKACDAALAMFDVLPKLNARWQPVLQEPLSFGVGVNSGIAQVGNVGSRIKFKYGALGNTVNLASRVQGATKYLKVPLLITDTTQALLEDHFPTRRLCQARVINIAQPVTLFELKGSGDEGWVGLKMAYEHALEEFSQKKFHQACRTLGRLMMDHPGDGPALVLLARAVACLVDEPDPFDPVMVLTGK